RFSCEVTTKCNISCDICTRPSLFKDGNLKVADMERPLIERILQEIKKFHQFGKRVYFVPMGLGEPLLFKGLFELFKELKDISKDISIILVTNGILLDESCIRQLILLEVDEVSVSLNTNNSEDYYKHMGADMYNKICRNTENLIKIRNESGKLLPCVFVQYIDYKNNQDLYRANIVNWLKVMRYNDKCYIHPIVNQAGLFGGGNSFAASMRNFPCTQPIWRIAIKVNGDMYPCDSCLYSGSNTMDALYLGNIMTESPFDQLNDRNNRRYKILESMRKEDYSQILECKKCNTYKLGSNCFFRLPGPLRIKGYKWI
ncbi:MAG: radical SAM protein, partial [Candidatus Omnitrophica bacterium]|nr:radical SAM protein [Candidatus Omnitrophota bacterium]